MTSQGQCQHQADLTGSRYNRSIAKVPRWSVGAFPPGSLARHDDETFFDFFSEELNLRF